MKISKLSILAILGLTLTSCGFPNIFENKLESLTLSDSVQKTYIVGESYLDFANLTIKGKYTDGSSKRFALSEVTTSLTLNGTTYNPNQPFTVAGNYSFRVVKDSVKSNALTVKVLSEPIYVETITVSGADTLAVNKSTNLTISAEPSDYTVDITAHSDNESIATVQKLNKTMFTVTGVSTGETDIVFTAPGSASTTVTEVHHITITENYATSISVKTGSGSVAKNSFVTVALQVNPTDFSTEVTATSGDTSVATIEKVDNLHFKVYGIAVGQTDITFSTLSAPGTSISCSHHISVTNMEKTTIEQTYENVIKHSGGKSACPIKDTPKLLVIPVWFTESSTYISTAYKDSIRSDISKAYFGSSSETGWHSVSSYYSEESRSEVTLTGTVSEWYTPSQTEFPLSDIKADDDYATLTRSLVNKATNWYFNNHTSDSRKNYDSDEDGYLDGVILIYAVPDYQSLHESQNNLWAYCYWTGNNKSVSNPTANVFFWASYDFMYGSTNVYSKTGANYANGDCSHCTIDAHTFIHEMGHVFGLEDYYDYAYSTNPAGSFSMQDCNVGGHDPYSVMAFGWADPYIPQTSCEITIQDFQSSRDLILLTPSWNNRNSPFDEYLLLELYSPTGLNSLDSTYQYKGSVKGPNTVGIRLWHVDARLYNNSTFTINANDSNVDHAFNNTSDYNVRPCKAVRKTYQYDYQKYTILQLIRNDKSVNYLTNSSIKGSDLFKSGSTFTMSDYQNQFPYGSAQLDKGNDLGWSFSVTSIVDNGGTYSATIQLTKA